MKKIVAALLFFLMILSLFSCRNKSIEDINYNPDNSTSSNASDNPTVNNTSANYDSVLRVYRRIVDSYPIVNQNPRALAAELGIQGEENIEMFVNLYSSVMLFYPGRGESNGESPHYKIGCGYALKDLNGDGVDELIFMNDDYYIMAVFSYADEKPILLGNYRPRNSCWIDGDGLLHENGSGGADHSTNAIYKIADGGKELEPIVEYGTNGHEWIEDVAYTIYYKLVNGEKKTITESEYNVLDEQYGKYLGSVAGAEATKKHSGLTFTSLYTEAEIAMEMYEAAINDEIFVLDERLGEITLKDCQFPSDGLRLDECDILYKAILDMDGDGINEYVIQSETKEHIVLHYYDGKVYSYCFTGMSFFNLMNDGFFYWIDSYDVNNCTRGCNRITFDGASCGVKEIYRIKQTSPYDYGDGYHEYYVDGKQITREEFRSYYDAIRVSGRLATFSPFDFSCEYPISSEKAFELASDYWGIKSGEEDGAAGSCYVITIVILEKPNNDTLNYHIGLHWARYSTHVIDNLFGQPPSTERIYEELIVDAITGECREYTDTERAMEMYEAFLKNEITTGDLGLYLKNYQEAYLMNYLWERNGSVHYAYVDMDGDGQVELLVSGIDTFVFSYSHKYNEVYRIGLYNFREMNGVYVDGSYSWNYPSSDGVSYGLKKDGKDIWRIENEGGSYTWYYIGDESVTQAEMLKYLEENPTPEEVKFTAISGEGWNKVIGEERAEEIASDYWKINDGDINEQTGNEYRIYVSGESAERYYVRLCCQNITTILILTLSI